MARLTSTAVATPRSSLGATPPPMQGRSTARAETALRQIVKGRSPTNGAAIPRPQICEVARTKQGETKNKKPGSLRIPGLCEQSVDGAR